MVEKTRHGSDVVEVVVLMMITPCSTFLTAIVVACSNVVVVVVVVTVDAHLEHRQSLARTSCTTNTTAGSGMMIIVAPI